MASYPAPETLSHDNFASILTRLKLLLDNLPDALPSHGDKSDAFGLFLMWPDDFVLDADWMEKTECEVATLSEMLKRVFASGKGHLALAVFRCFSCPRAS